MTTRQRAVQRYLDKLRPRQFDDLVGQPRLLHTLERLVDTAASRRRPLVPVMIIGDADIGKRDVAEVVASEYCRQVEGDVHRLSARRLAGGADLDDVLDDPAQTDVVIVDGCHRLDPARRRQLAEAVGECKPVFDERLIDEAEPTTSGPSFGVVATAEFRDKPALEGWTTLSMRSYDTEELTEMASRLAERLDIELTDQAAFSFARRSWGGAPRLRRLLVQVLFENVELLSRQGIWRIDESHIERVAG